MSHTMLAFAVPCHGVASEQKYWCKQVRRATQRLEQAAKTAATAAAGATSAAAAGAGAASAGAGTRAPARVPAGECIQGDVCSKAALLPGAPRPVEGMEGFLRLVLRRRSGAWTCTTCSSLP